MKKIVLIIVALLVVVATGLLAYRSGYASGRSRTLGLSRGTFTLTLAALEALATNDIPAAIDYLDGQCYSHAVFLLDDRHWRQGVCVQTIMPDLVEYRRQHASDPSNWSPMERTLEDLLIKHGWKEKANQASEAIGASAPQPQR